MADVICRGCAGVFHETTERFHARKPANGAMFRLKEPYFSWGWQDFPKDEAMAYGALECPQCGTPYPDQNGFVKLVPGKSIYEINQKRINAMAAGKPRKAKSGNRNTRKK